MVQVSGRSMSVQISPVTACYLLGFLFPMLRTRVAHLGEVQAAQAKGPKEQTEWISSMCPPPRSPVHLPLGARVLGCWPIAAEYVTSDLQLSSDNRRICRKLEGERRAKSEVAIYSPLFLEPLKISRTDFPQGEGPSTQPSTSPDLANSFLHLFHQA